MIRVNTLVEEAIFRLANNIASDIDWEFVYYEYYIDIIEDDIKRNVGELLVKSNIFTESDEIKEKIDILKNVIKENLGMAKVLEKR